MITDTEVLRPTVGGERGEPEIVPLNLVFDYPVSWTRYKTLRDLVQNFYDAVGYEAWRERFRTERHGDLLLLKARHVRFSYDWLIPIGASTKREVPGAYAGYFGEGFKIASLCALRDHGWNIELASQDWELRVAVEDLSVAGRKLPSLAYHLWKRPQTRRDTVLALYPFRECDDELLESAIVSFFYPENPLFGAEIWSSSSAAVFHRSSKATPEHVPATSSFSLHGSGIVFAGYQALGSFPFPLIVAQHDFHRKDRDRNAFYEWDVLELIERVCRVVSPACAFQLLEVFQSKWYAYPRKRFDLRSWYPVITRLVERLESCPDEVRRWRDKYPRLLVAERVSRRELAQYNRRRQALAWQRRECPDHRLVQDAFLTLGYTRLETACQAAGGLSEVRDPRGIEVELIRVLEHLTSTILDDFFGDEPLPPCKVIDGNDASWEGIASTVRLPRPRRARHGHSVRYSLPWVALKQRTLVKDGFQQALSTYLHELSHCFGGDQSARFSHALTDILRITLQHGQEIASAKATWDEIHERAGCWHAASSKCRTDNLIQGQR